MTKYERKEPLPPLIDRFEDFYIRYSLGAQPEGCAVGSLTAEVWSVMEWAADETPVFFTASPHLGLTGRNPEECAPLFEMWVKWDGCSHLWLPYFHFDDEDQLEALKRCIAWVRDDLCEKNGVTD